MERIPPTLKALLVTILFAAVACWTLMYRAPSSPVLAPQIIFYAILVLNTFLSVRFYSKIQPNNTSQALIDFLLVVTYIALSLSFGRPVEFMLAALCLFAAAPFKYIFMRGLIPYDALLKRKIKIDFTGTALCALILVGTLARFAVESAWTFAIIFTLANVYLIGIKPMYRL